MPLPTTLYNNFNQGRSFTPSVVGENILFPGRNMAPLYFTSANDNDNFPPKNTQTFPTFLLDKIRVFSFQIISCFIF